MCIGTPTEIKRNYGSGLILNLIFDRHAGFNEESRPAVIEGLRDMFDYLCKEGILKSYRLRGESDQKSPSVISPSRPKQPNVSLPAASLRTAQFEVEVDDEHVLDLFDYLEQNKGEFMVGHYELAQSPLKDVFEKIVLSDS